MFVEHLSICVEFVWPCGTRMYLSQRGFTTHFHWLMECFQRHLKDSMGSPACFYPLMLAMGQWNGVKTYPSVTEVAPKYDLLLMFDFQAGEVGGVFNGDDFHMDMQEWIGTNLTALPFVDQWGEGNTFEGGADLDDPELEALVMGMDQ